MAPSRCFCALSRAEVENIKLLGHGQLSVIGLIGHEPSPLPHPPQTKRGTNFIGNSLTPFFLSHFPVTHSFPRSSHTFRQLTHSLFLSHFPATPSLPRSSHTFRQLTHSLFLSHFSVTHSLPRSSHTSRQLTHSLVPLALSGTHSLPLSFHTFR